MASRVGDVADIVARIEPFDEVEREHVEETVRWLGTTEDVYRRVKPDVPAKHLVSYVVVVDPRERVVLLGRHVLAGLWLPMGGHVEMGEHPLAAARREAGEELGIEAEFDVVGEDPVFLTVTTTVGVTAGHVDVSLWYVVRGERGREYSLDPAEFEAARWWDIDGEVAVDSDPHLGRFLAKLGRMLG